jgi:hypothetical protein
MSEAMDILECIGCEQLIFPGEEIEQTSEGPVCSFCLTPQKALASVSH